MSPLLSVRDLHVRFPITRAGDMPWTKPRFLHAVNGVSFDLEPGKTLGVVGESGCGKSTLARGLIQMVPATGQVMWRGETDLLSLSPRRMKPYRSEIQMVFQDPLASLNPRMTLGQIIAEPLRTHRPDISAKERRNRVAQMMERVGLLPQMINRYPHEFSGGQCQRIGIARALIVEPKLLICDEPVSALDVSIQAQVIELLKELQRDLGLAMIFIAHDLSVVKNISDEVMVLYLGRIMEKAPKAQLYDNPQHPYTQALLSAVPIPDPVAERAKKIVPMTGDMPSPMNPPSGCVFRGRCPRAQADCAAVVPEPGNGPHQVACIHPGPMQERELTTAR
ncbi:Oligopeptide transport ATP-binding protein OppF (plasmid) [Sulfitobacter indolifex]|uniref:Oligopeptide ABC transport system ATP-binding protein OppF n=1 Tax=Sulfitobacter indolifex HEL-45 TaxID=391624 RepID=A0ABM9X0J5_9RHOB|nr:oligopeptide/dipeptide ABC transporter ATP-binding protein [Sulfitobacter indolifex]EDQ02993.1 oligopeptide ABC transport system ATP-binding protein OppF [Sulfitobacter indolifex HEL-45]UOA21112.1 Oligopeptide transport ATP-binding protein OppF [Sulfitobacter indolifex]